MLQLITPVTLFHRQLTAIQQNLPAVLDGQAEGIHAARVATRRVRELLPLLPRERRRADVDDLRVRFKRLGRSLGRVRDADVRVALLASLEQRIPHAAPTLVLVRQRREHERLALMRKMIKRLERLDAIRMVDALARESPGWLAMRRWGWGLSWQRKLRSVVCTRAEEARDAIDHATGVYFPNRAHSARIAIKKLRYSAEIVHDTGVANRTDTIRQLKRAQDLLGDLHDMQELCNHLTDKGSQETPATDADAQVALVCQVIDAEGRALHQRYVERRDKLIAACRDAADLPLPPDRHVPSIVTVTTLAVSAGLYALNRAHRHSLSQLSGRDELFQTRDARAM